MTVTGPFAARQVRDLQRSANFSKPHPPVRPEQSCSPPNTWATVYLRALREQRTHEISGHTPTRDSNP